MSFLCFEIVLYFGNNAFRIWKWRSFVQSCVIRWRAIEHAHCSDVYIWSLCERPQGHLLLDIQ